MSLNTSTTAIGTMDVHGSVFGVFWGSRQLSPFWGGSGRRALSPPPPPGNPVESKPRKLGYDSVHMEGRDKRTLAEAPGQSPSKNPDALL